MSKIAQYLNEHILGEVITDESTRAAFSTDASVLTIKPEMVVYPRVTNDIRKVARFAWQLAEKGHVLPLTPRGGGSDQTGAALGKGATLSLTAYMNKAFEIDAKQKLVRIQPGMTFGALNEGLRLQGFYIPSYPASASYSTVGGAIANNASGMLSGRFGDTAAWVAQLEVVLANGDVLQTGRISKRELNKKKGLTGFEGEIYRQLDGLIADHASLIAEKLAGDERDNIGYKSLAKVKHKDGSFDLTPLFVGSQGTLGIVSEIIMKTEFVSTEQSVVVAAFESQDTARDALDELAKLEPSVLDMLDGRLFESAAKLGKKYPLYSKAKEKGAVGALVITVFDEFNARGQQRKLKKAIKSLEKLGALVETNGNDGTDDLLTLRDVTAVLVDEAAKGTSYPPILDGAAVPLARLEDFSHALSQLETRHHVDLPLCIRGLEGVILTRPLLQLQKVGDKQKVFKLLDEYAALVAQYGGQLVAQSAEGRLKAPFAYKQLDDDVKELFAAVKTIFDPYGILNPGVKQKTDLRELAGMLRHDYSLDRFAGQSLSS